MLLHPADVLCVQSASVAATSHAQAALWQCRIVLLGHCSIHKSLGMVSIPDMLLVTVLNVQQVIGTGPVRDLVPP
jgi:hypothetical protein